MALIIYKPRKVQKSVIFTFRISFFRELIFLISFAQSSAMGLLPSSSQREGPCWVTKLAINGKFTAEYPQRKCYTHDCRSYSLSTFQTHHSALRQFCLRPLISPAFRMWSRIRDYPSYGSFERAEFLCALATTTFPVPGTGPSPTGTQGTPLKGWMKIKGGESTNEMFPAK